MSYNYDFLSIKNELFELRIHLKNGSGTFNASPIKIRVVVAKFSGQTTETETTIKLR